MTKHPIGTYDEWLSARIELLKAEKEHTRRGDDLARQRQELPWLRVEKPYRFDTDEGNADLTGLFKGRSQLLVYHLMFGPDYEAACPSCSNIADGFNGIAAHLANHDVMFWAISRAPLEKLQAFKKRMGWTFPWASSFGGEFNSDFHVWFTEQEERAGTVEYNYRREDPDPELAPGQPHPADNVAKLAGTDGATFIRERPGMSSFIRNDGEVYHTYSAFARGLDGLWNTYQWLDRAPLGRNETGYWMRHHDSYGK